MKMIQKCISGCLAVLILFSLLPVQTFAAELPQNTEEAVRLENELTCSAEEIMTPEEQYEGYAYQTFYGNAATFGVSAGNRLEGIDKVLYDALVSVFREIANGERSSTVIRVGQDVNYQGEVYPADVEATFTESTFNLAVLHDALLGDLPYDLYWYDKTTGVRASRWVRGSELVQVEFYFSVADNYQGSEEYSTNTSKTGAASKAAANAKSIVSQYAGVTDYEKLVGYKNEIQARVEYDHDAADGGYFDTYIDPWQLISVFDGDPSTNVVCEGYSKAFMYLCDLTAFTGDITCYTVSGDLNGGAHMWNTVSIEGKNYLVDVTNSEVGTVGQNGGLFLNGVQGDPWNGYVAAGVLFEYDSDMFTLWGEDADSILFLEATDYDPSTAKVETPVVTSLKNAAEGIKITWGAVPGAVRYRVYVKTSGGWTNLGSTTETSFVYTGAKSGTTYTFTVRCVNAADKVFTSDYNTTGWTQSYIAQPAITKLENTETGVRVSWNAVGGAGKYRVYIQSGTGWTKVGETAGTSLTWTGAKSGTTYTFTIRALNADTSAAGSSYSTTGWKKTYVAQPAVSGLENTAEGIKLTWNAVNGAGIYRVFVKTAKGWQEVGDTAGTSFIYTGAQSGLTYTFTVRAMDAAAVSYVSSYNATGWTQTYVDQPVISKLESAGNGVTITWNAVGGAGKYRVFVKNAKGAWTPLGDTAATSFTWTGAKTGTTYTFTVRALNAGGTTFVSSYNAAGWKYTYSPTPVVTKLESNASGIKLTWNAINGAQKYRVFVKTATGWTAVGDTAATSFTWTGAEAGVSYTFTVRCVNTAGGFTSAYNTAGWKHTYYPTPVVTKLESNASGIKLTWNAINGAQKYRVFVKTAKGWTAVGDTAGTSFVYTGVAEGQTYTFTVRCVNAAGGFASAYDATGWTQAYLAQPGVSSLESTTAGVKITWNAVDGAEKYRIFVKSATGAWTKAGDTTDTAFTWTGAKTGETYTFTVRCIDAAGVFTSAYNTTGWNYTYMPAPEVTEVTSVSSGIKLTWGAINGAEKYRVFVKNAAGAWIKAGDTTGTTFTWTGAKKGETYTFTVRCIDANGGFTSAYNTTGWSHKHN